MEDGHRTNGHAGEPAATNGREPGMIVLDGAGLIRWEKPEPSTYLRYLPAVYSTDDFMGRFLRIFETIWNPIESRIDNMHYFFDPGLTPTDVLPWLASWMDLVLDERWPEVKRRQLVRSAAELYRWRGTKRGLRQFIELYTGIEPQIDEYTANQPPSPTNQPYTFTVTLQVPEGKQVQPEIVQRIIEAEKPAHTAYNLVISEAS